MKYERNLEAIKMFKGLFGNKDNGFAYHYDSELELWEIIFFDTEFNGSLIIDSHEYEKMNLAGFIYAGVQTDIDYENEGETKFMDIAYFKYVGKPDIGTL